MSLRTKIINIWGSPGVGKSTLAAEIYVELKKQNKSVELVTEVAKDYVYRGQRPTKDEQLSIATKQLYVESLKYNKVEFIITDCPVLLPYFYLETNHNIHLTYPFLSFYNHSLSINGIKSYDFLLERYFEYDPNGRFETENESEILDQKLYKFLDKLNISFNSFEPSSLVKTVIVGSFNE